MKKKVTILSSKKGEKINTLKKLHKKNPLHARVIYHSDNYQHYCENERLIMEEYFHDDGTVDISRLRTYLEVKVYYIDDDLKLRIHKDTTYSFSYKNGKFKGLYKPIDYSTFLTDISFSEIGIKTESYDLTNLTIRHLIKYQNSSRYNHIQLNSTFLRIWLDRFPWILFFIEHNIYLDVPLNTIIDKELFNLKSALRDKFHNVPFKKALELHEHFTKKHYLDFKEIKGKRPLDSPYEHIDNYLKRGFLLIDDNTYGDVSNEMIVNAAVGINDGINDANLFTAASVNNCKFINNVFENLPNLNIAWFCDNSLGRLVHNVCKYGFLLGRKVNCKWSDNKLKEINKLWSREYSCIIHEYDNREFNIYKIFRLMGEASSLRLISNRLDLSYEGFRQNHCVGGYENRIDNGKIAIYHYKGFTIQLNFDELSDLRGINTIRRYGLIIGEFRSFGNSTPSDELRNEVEAMVINFNKYLLSTDLSSYKLLIDEVNDSRLEKKSTIQLNFDNGNAYGIPNNQMIFNEMAVDEGINDVVRELVREVPIPDNGEVEILNTYYESNESYESYGPYLISSLIEARENAERDGVVYDADEVGNTFIDLLSLFIDTKIVTHDDVLLFIEQNKEMIRESGIEIARMDVESVKWIINNAENEIDKRKNPYYSHIDKLNCEYENNKRSAVLGSIVDSLNPSIKRRAMF